MKRENAKEVWVLMILLVFLVLASAPNLVNSLQNDSNLSLNNESNREWKLFKTGLVPGEEYSFILTPDDPGFGEIIITNAQHLDSDRNFISDIYDEVKEKDGVWSEEINSDEYVRVNYEDNLTNGNIIDVFVRGNGNFEVYEKDKNLNLGDSGEISSFNGKWEYITLENMIGFTDIFDFKISGSLEFDYIHDAPPNLSSVILNSTFGTNLTTENLTVYTDQDNNASLKLIYNWKKDGSSIAVLNMPFEGGSNSTFTKDYSDNANNATGFNGSLWQGNGGYDGKGAYKFDRASDTYFTVPDFNYTDNFTITFWFNTSALSGSLWHYVYSHGTWNAVNNVRIYFAESNGELFTQIRDSNDPDISTLSPAGFDDGNWHFYTLTVDKTVGVKLYIDGVLDSSNSTHATDSFNPGTDLFIGGRSDLNPDRHYNGWLDELRVYNRALSLDQIILLNNSQPEKIHSSETSVDDVWEVEVTPNDGFQDGTSILSNNLTVLADPIPVSTLFSPQNNSLSIPGNITFRCNATDDVNLANLSLYITNSSNKNFSLNQTTNISGTTNSTNWILELGIGDYTWNCLVYDSDGNSAFAISNRSLNVNSSGSVSVRIGQSSDDAEEAVDGPNTGDTEITSSDLEMVEDLDFQAGNQEIGLRFQNVEIPNSATVTNAYIEFEVDEINSSTTNLRIYGEDEDNPDTFYFGLGNFNITPRTKTSAFASWDNIPAWNTVSEKQQTVDISNVVKEIVDRSGWSSGNSMIFIINGTGKRVAEAWDGESANAPLLVVNWTTVSNSAPSITSIILNSTLGTNLTSENLTAYAINVSDPENDSVKVIYNWNKDSQSIAVLNMPFEGGSNSTFTKDYSANANGTVVNAIWNSTEGYDGKGAYEFLDGIEDYIVIDVPSGQQVLNAFTFSAWVYQDLSEDGTLFQFYENDVSRLQIHYDNLGAANNTIYIFDDINDAGDSLIFSGSSAPMNSWQHVVISVSGTNYSLYQNGLYVSSVTKGNISDITSARYYIGARNLTSSTFSSFDFDGTIDEVIVYNRSLSAEQVSALYNNRTDLIVSQETEINDTWSVSITPNDGFQDGISVLSNNLTILVPSFNGSVRNLTGSLIPNSNVSILETEDFTITPTGNYNLIGIPDGLYSLTASKEGYLNQTKSNQLAEFGKTKQVDFNLGQLGGIKGNVLDFFNITGINNANLSLFLYDEFLNSTLTNNTGSYEFNDLAPGYYDINITATGYDDNSKPDNHVLGGENATVNFWLF